MFGDEADLKRADWPLLQDGAVNLFRRIDIFEETQGALAVLGYDVLAVDCRSGWSAFQDQISLVLRWQEQFGYAGWNGNLNALNDALRYFPFGPSKRSALA
ncbi:MAG TPA: hypothetical protein VF409_02135 [Sphingomonas sp.]